SGDKGRGPQGKVEIEKGIGYRPGSMIDEFGGGRPFEGEWALILGASSGFGAATARELGRRGMGILGVHLDRKATMPLAEAVAADVEGAGSPVYLFNVNAADDERRIQVCNRAVGLIGGEGARAGLPPPPLPPPHALLPAPPP